LPIPEDVFVNTFSDEWTIKIVHGPNPLTVNLYGEEDVNEAHHIVAITLLNPTKSIVAAKLSASSGWFPSIPAVSQALRYANFALGVLISMSCATVSFPS
jgi:hypothetical protein